MYPSHSNVVTRWKWRIQKNVERLLHDVFQDFRVRKNREFFDIKIERVISALQLTGGKEIESNTSTTNEDVDPEALEKANRRSNINLLTLKISIGDTLHFTENTDIKCTVKSAREVEFDGQVMSLTQAALQARILNAQINNTEEIRSPSISGSDFWCFESDKTLHTRRLRIEQEA